mmetsp:Transcript_103480/g.166838  ORF Transcript_103480/g.166838 Transcript_103480/m.166838 type:complete len:85 (+) Transcript_103480:249-503(+)
MRTARFFVWQQKQVLTCIFHKTNLGHHQARNCCPLIALCIWLRCAACRIITTITTITTITISPAAELKKSTCNAAAGLHAVWHA